MYSMIHRWVMQKVYTRAVVLCLMSFFWCFGFVSVFLPFCLVYFDSELSQSLTQLDADSALSDLFRNIKVSKFNDVWLMFSPAHSII